MTMKAFIRSLDDARLRKKEGGIISRSRWERRVSYKEPKQCYSCIYCTPSEVDNLAHCQIMRENTTSDNVDPSNVCNRWWRKK